MLAYCFLLTQLVAIQPKTGEIPQCFDTRLVIERVAADPEIVHPVGLTFDHRGRLLVIESHTHFRPKNYQGPKYDRIRILEDTDGDGRADRFTTFFEGTTATMDIACHSDGSIYVATRNEILRLRDTNDDGVADKKHRIVFLDTPGNYPHNGLSGLAFDKDGNLFFGMGENLGVKYRLVANDGTSASDEGEGGNIFWCTANGQKLRRVATGIWNPFGVCLDKFGNVFAVDNDPDAMPPCRLLHVVEGSDYGYQFRYGRSGKHPFQSWNGQLAGTLPMMAGTGEGPCEVLSYQGKGLPEEYLGDLFVTAWADHRVERYRLASHGVSYRAERLPFIQGGRDFRPVGLAVAPDGSIYFSDWVLANYELHGKGAVWRVRPREVLAKEPRPEPLQALNSQELLRKIEKLSRWADLVPVLQSEDHFLRHAGVRRLSQLPDVLLAQQRALPDDPRLRLGILLAQRQTEPPHAAELARSWIKDADPEVRFLAAKWIADRQLRECKPALLEALNEPSLSVRLYQGLGSALSRVSGQDVSEVRMAEFYFKRVTDDEDSSPELRIAALRALPASHKPMTLELLEKLLRSPNSGLRRESIRVLQEHPDLARFKILADAAETAELELAARAEAILGLANRGQDATDALLGFAVKGPALLRVEALRGLVGLSLTPEQRAELHEANRPLEELKEPLARLLGQPFLGERPHATDTSAWLKLLEGPGDAEAGRRVFFHPRLAGCSKCHRVDGRGNDIGPDLSAIGRTERRHLVESVLQPSSTVAPHYTAWRLATSDGQVRTGLLIRTYLDEYTYIDEKGEPFTLRTVDIVESQPARQSIMPERLADGLTLQELRDLLAYLESRK